jgi:anti-anti-sigma regulatory factor
MRWRRTTGRHTAPIAVADPVVLPVTRALNRETALDVVEQVDRLGGVPVVIDLTGIPSFDSDGAEMLLGLQESQGLSRVSIVGFRQASARLMGTGAPAATTTAAVSIDAGWVIRRLRNLVVVQATDGEILSTDDLESTLVSALGQDAAIVVVDLRNTLELTVAGLQAIAFASSSAALRGQELLIVNVTAEGAEMLRGAGLSATTYVSPEPPLRDLPAW